MLPAARPSRPAGTCRSMLELLPFVAPLALILAAALGFRERAGGPARSPRRAELFALLAVAAALLTACLTALHGSATGPLLGAGGWGLAARTDPVSATMLLLVSFVGWVVLRYSATYLDGEARHGAFTGWMSAALAAVMLLVIAGNLLQLLLAWVAISFCLHRLLLFRAERVAARRAARKKAVTATLGGLAMLGAVVLLGSAFGTGDIATILSAARAGAAPPGAVWAAVLLAVAALLKSAQFPTQGWLTEVMEAPTPVSALLHAGIVNAGGFLLVRFADLLLLAPLLLAALVTIGGLTAIVGALVMLTQSVVKTSLAWSTVSQMGFMVMQCGLALFPLALLHIVAHSLYKAHAFLAAGETVERVAAARRPGPVAVPGVRAVGRAFLTAAAICAGTGLLFGFDGQSPQAVALGAILIFGAAYLIAQGLAGEAPKALGRHTLLCALAATLGWFALHAVSERLFAGTLPAAPAPGPLEWALLALALVSFGTVAVAQSMFPLWAYHPAMAGLRVHLVNGLYANALTDRLLRGWSTAR